MDKTTLLRFIHQICLTCDINGRQGKSDVDNCNRAKERLEQLYDMLKLQGIDEKSLQMLRNAIDDRKELIEDVVGKQTLTEYDLAIATRRRKERERREAEAARSGRC